MQEPVFPVRLKTRMKSVLQSRDTASLILVRTVLMVSTVARGITVMSSHTHVPPADMADMSDLHAYATINLHAYVTHQTCMHMRHKDLHEYMTQ